MKPAASGDLWSKNGTALFGLVSHGIKRRRVVAADGSSTTTWTMCEKLCGAVPCRQDRHTGKYIGEMSDAAWASSGISKPAEQLFVRVCDNGSNMVKGWEEGCVARCADHTMELSTNLYTTHDDIAPTLDKGRGRVTY